MIAAEAKAQCAATLDGVASGVLVERETLGTILADFVGRGRSCRRT